MNESSGSADDGRPHETRSASLRIEQMETLFAHLERQFEQLNSVVIEQGKTLVRLQKRLEDLDQAVLGQDLERSPSAQQKPPHYLP